MAERGFEIVGGLEQVEVIASGRTVRERARLRQIHGQGRWRKLKGIARVRISGERVVWAEVHWYEAHGIGMREVKIKRLVVRR